LVGVACRGYTSCTTEAARVREKKKIDQKERVETRKERENADYVWRKREKLVPLGGGKGGNLSPATF